MAVDRLRQYREKRDFDVTAEPAGSVGTPPASAGGHRFVVQRHRATRLHYDLRLEMAGVLASWAVPKGPTLDPGTKRMAVHVEDHPLDYFDFEGVIPAGECGGGDVIVWDWGTWHVSDGADPVDAVERGDVHFDLRGEKLRGHFVLIRRSRDGAKQWLLLKKRDADAEDGWDPEDHPRSVKTGRTNDEVKAAPSASWSGSAIWAAPTADELAALDEIGESGDWRVGEHTMRLANLDTVLVPSQCEQSEYTKRELVRHYAIVAPVILPYLAERPVIAHRFPHGIGENGTWQRRAPGRAPDWIGRWPERDDAPSATHLLVDSPAALAWLANRAAIELAVWSSTVQHPQRPTWAVITLSPGRHGTFEDVLVVARLHRTALEHLDLRAAPVLDGSSGLQVWIPVSGDSSFDDTTEWLATLISTIGDTVPELVGEHVQLARAGDPLVVPFSARPAPGAPVVVPVAWDELDDPELVPDRWTIGNIAERVTSDGDPLAPLIGLSQRLPRL